MQYGLSNRKTFASVFISIIAILSLCSCSTYNRGSVSIDEPKSSSIVQSADDPDSSSLSSANPDSGNATIDLHNAGKYEYVTATEGAYVIEQLYPQSSTISYIDYETGIKSPLCSTPGCTHQNDSCPSYISMTGYFPPRILWAGKYLLVANEAASENGSCKIERRNPDGSGAQGLCQFDSNDYITGDYLYDSSFLYLTKVKTGPSGDQQKVFLAINLENGTIRELLTLGENDFVVGGYGSKVIIQSYDYNNAKTDYSSFDLLSGEKSSCISFDMNNGHTAVCNSGIIMINSNERILRWLPISREGLIGDMQDMPIQLPDNVIAATVFPLFDNYVELDVSYSEGQENATENYIIDLDNKTQDKSSMTLASQGILLPIVGEYGDILCVISNIEIRNFQFYSTDGILQNVDYVGNQYGLLKKSDYLSSKINIKEIKEVGN